MEFGFKDAVTEDVLPWTESSANFSLQEETGGAKSYYAVLSNLKSYK